MMKLRHILCVLLSAVMICSISACDRTSSDEGDKESNAPAETGSEVSTAPPEGTPDEASAAVSLPSDPPEERSDLVILNWEEYVNRPHEIQPGTVLNYAAPNDVPSQLPWNCPAEGWLWGNIYEGLLYMYMSDPTDIRGCIAENWNHSDDYLTWTFKIREGIKFHDGTPCDAPAIQRAWKYTQEASPAYITNSNITSWEAIDSSTLVVHLTAPCAYFEQKMCDNTLMPVSPTALALNGISDNRAAIGTGPYYIDAYTSGKSIVLRANPDYFLEEKMPCIETVNFNVIRGNEDALSALLNGNNDGANLFLQSFNFIGGYNVNSYQYFQEEGYDGQIIACFGYGKTLWLNAKKVEFFRTLEVREAMCRFIDFSAINDELFDGWGSVQDSLWAKGSSGYVRTDQFYCDPDEGRELLASVGIEPSDIKFETLRFADDDIYAAVQQELERANVKLELEYIDPKSSFTYYMKDDWAIRIESTGYSDTTPYIPWRYILRSDALIKMCWQDIYDPDLYQKMLSEYDAMTASTTWDEMLTHCRQLTTYVQDDYGAIGGVQSPAFVALSKDFKNGIYFSESHDIQLYYLYQ